MNILDVLIALACFGFLMWLITLVEMPPKVKQIIIGVGCFVLIMYVALSLLTALGYESHFTKVIHW